MGFDVDKPKSGSKSKIPKKRMEQIEEEIDDNTYKAICKGIGGITNK